MNFGNPQDCSLNWKKTSAQKIYKLSNSKPDAIQLSTFPPFLLLCLNGFYPWQEYVCWETLGICQKSKYRCVLGFKMNIWCDMTKFLSKKAEPQHVASSALTSTNLVSYDATLLGLKSIIYMSLDNPVKSGKQQDVNFPAVLWVDCWFWKAPVYC